MQRSLEAQGIVTESIATWTGEQNPWRTDDQLYIDPLPASLNPLLIAYTGSPQFLRLLDALTTRQKRISEHERGKTRSPYKLDAARTQAVVHFAGVIFEDLSYDFANSRLLRNGETLLTPGETHILFDRAAKLDNARDVRYRTKPDLMILRPETDRTLIVGVGEATIGRRSRRKHKQLIFFESGNVARYLMDRTQSQIGAIEGFLGELRPDLQMPLAFDETNYRTLYMRTQGRHQPGVLGLRETHELPISTGQLLEFSHRLNSQQVVYEKVG